MFVGMRSILGGGCAIASQVGYADAPPVVTLHNADTSSGWTGVTLDTADKKEGSASLSGVSDTGISIPGYPSAIIMQGVFAPLNTDRYYDNESG